MKFSRKLACLTFCASTYAGVGHAGVIYNEATDGDASDGFAGAFVGANVGALTVGTNTILGDIRESRDDYIFTIPVGTVLGGFSVAFSLGLSQMWNDLYSSAGVLLSSAGDVEGSVFGDVLPLGPGTYRIDNVDAAFAGNAPYEWTLTLRATETVPEPATLALLGLGLAGLGTIRRKRS